MKKIWNRYSYAIILILLSFSAAFILSGKSTNQIDEEYISVKVLEGDSLWEISEKYAEEHNLTPQQFINWVKKTNGIDEYIYAGDSIVIPVSKENLYANNFASIDNDYEQ